MSADDALLIFMNRDGGISGWLHLADGAIAARGTDIAEAPPAADPSTGAALRIVAVVPGEDIALHWAELPSGLSEPQAVAAARLLAPDLSAQPVDELHVAVGPEEDGTGLRPIALVSALSMARWIGALQSLGLDPDIILPEPLLLPQPLEGYTRFEGARLPLLRGATEAFAIEPDLADAVTAGRSVDILDADRFEAGLPDALASLPVNLRQGAFSKRTRWRIDWARVRRQALLAAALLIVTFGIQVALILRYTYAADRLDAEAHSLARTAVPGLAATTDPVQALDIRLNQLGGSSGGFSGSAAILFAGVQAVPNVQLKALVYDPAGGLRATIVADTPASITALQQRVVTSGAEAKLGAMRSDGGQPAAELTVKAR